MVAKMIAKNKLHEAIVISLLWFIHNLSYWGRFLRSKFRGND